MVRITGSLDFSDHAVKYVAFGRDDARTRTARGALLLQELGPLKEAVMTAWRRTYTQMPALYVEHTGPKLTARPGHEDPEGFVSWPGLTAATAMLGDRPKLRGLCEQFSKQVKELDDEWFRARTELTRTNPQASNTDVALYHRDILRSLPAEGLRPRLAAHTTYAAILSHIDELVT